jgi:hypothetical protein
MMDVDLTLGRGYVAFQRSTLTMYRVPLRTYNAHCQPCSLLYLLYFCCLG